MTRLDKKESSPDPGYTEPHTDLELKEELMANMQRIEQKVINGELTEQELLVMKKSLEIGGIGESQPDLAKLVRNLVEKAEDFYSFGSDSPYSTSTFPDLNTGA